jgi:hypothetical protein
VVNVVNIMKTSTLACSILGALLLAPAGAFARDKHREDCNDALAQIYADRVAHGYCPDGSPGRVYNDNCAPRGYSRDYRAFDPRCRDDRRDDRRAPWFRGR